MKRTLYTQLIAWKASKNRKPLILRGARQVGKTFMLKAFGDKEYPSTVYLNFEEDPKLKSFFLEDLKPATILGNLEAYLGQKILPENTLLIFDEIQESPEALNSLKYFQEQANEYHIVSAGSLLGVKLSHTKGFPVGKVNFLDLYPLSFFEFLIGMGKEKLCDYLMQQKTISPFPDAIHQELLSLLKKYLYIGGMPEAVAEYVNTGNLLSIRQIQNEILSAYALDFAKHAPKEQIMKITDVWESIPSQLAKENKKFIFRALKESARGREYADAIQWLADAGLIHKSYHISAPELPLAGFTNENTFKVFLVDVGLLSAMSHVPTKLAVDEEGLFNEFQGAFTENFIAQELAILHSNLYYWTSEGIAELDFVIEHDMSVYPLEVKSGVSRRKKSLLVYREKYQPKLLLRTSQMNLKKDGDIVNIPLYLISQIFQLID